MPVDAVKEIIKSAAESGGISSTFAVIGGIIVAALSALATVLVGLLTHARGIDATAHRSLTELPTAISDGFKKLVETQHDALDKVTQQYNQLYEMHGELREHLRELTEDVDTLVDHVGVLNSILRGADIPVPPIPPLNHRRPQVSP